MTNLNFTLYDSFVDVIPGVIALLLILPLLPETGQLNVILDGGLVIAMLVLIAGYIIGHFLQGFASWTDSSVRLRIVSKLNIDAETLTILYPFEEELENMDEDSAVYSGFMEAKNELFDAALTDGDLFRAVQSYLWNYDIGRMRRFQTLYTFFRSLWVLLFLGAIVYGFFSILSCLGIYTPIVDGRYLGLLSIVLLGGAIGAYLRRVRFHREMARAMIYDVYTHWNRDG